MMRLRLASLVALSASLAFAACTKNNPNYCAEAGSELGNSCAELDARRDRPAPQDVRDAADAGDVADAIDAADTGDATDTSDVKAPICSMDDQCAAMDAGTAACDTTDGGARCVECTQNMHCKGAKPICDMDRRVCVECTGVVPTDECKAAGKTACNTTTHTCVQCVDDSQCGGATPICGKTDNLCRICKADSECTGKGPGICVDWDGHCATSAEVVLLDRSPGCDTAQAPFCTSAGAIANLIGEKRIVLVTGAQPVASMIITASAPTPLLILGRGGASISAGSGDIADIAMDGARKVYVRDLKLTGATTGIVVFGGAELHLTRAVVTGNTSGGIQIKNGSFDITNTIVASNGLGDAIGGIAWAGARLGDLATGGPSRFENNTVVDNAGPGVSCAAAYPILASIVRGNVGAQTVGCMAPPTPCCGVGDPDPKLDASYHLMSTSLCIDKVDATMSTLTVDVQGESRPAGAKLDCGADEFHN